MRRKASKKEHREEIARSVPVSSMIKTKGKFQNLGKHRDYGQKNIKSQKIPVVYNVRTQQKKRKRGGKSDCREIVRKQKAKGRVNPN